VEVCLHGCLFTFLIWAFRNKFKNCKLVQFFCYYFHANNQIAHTFLQMEIFLFFLQTSVWAKKWAQKMLVWRALKARSDMHFLIALLCPALKNNAGSDCIKKYNAANFEQKKKCLVVSENSLVNLCWPKMWLLRSFLLVFWTVWMGYALLHALAWFFNANVKKREEKCLPERGFTDKWLQNS